ncbi:MAG: UvrD-helicase domain-containing protein [Candidatus Taylorbacteria bacterium]
MSHHLDELNFEQKEAVCHTEGPLLVIAGAGAGKTKAITHRILHLIKQGVPPHAILAITFTNKAAKEMRDRVSALLKNDKELNLPISFEERPFVSTFHALGVHIIKENAGALGLTRYFTIFDRNDSLRAVKEALQSADLDPKQFEPGKILRIISKEKGNFVTEEMYEETVGNSYFPRIVSLVWKKYEDTLRKEKALDFDDLLLKTALLLKNKPGVRERYQTIWKYIHIDEYQDTNRVQYEIARLLSEKYRNLCVVGDADQNIYSFRGADIKNILDFEKDYPDARTILLEQNYRSTQNILHSANTVIKKNKRRKEKNLYTKNGEGEKLTLFEGYDEVEEAHFIAQKAKELGAKGVSLEEIAVLFRANFQSRILEEAFLSHTVPYQVLGVRFFERKEIKDVLSYIRASLNPDALSDIKRIINSPPRGLGKVTLIKIFANREADLPAGARAKVAQFKNLLLKIKEEIEKLKPADLIKFVIKESGLEESLKKGGDDDLERLENLRELVTVATKYHYLPLQEGIEKLLEEAALASDQDELAERKNGVKLMTVHASKGLEFEYVFITGLEEDLFPHRKITEDDVSEEAGEEERRLFYVALTRAKKKVYLTFAGIRTIFGSKHMNIPSEFLGDLDESLLETEEGEFLKEIRF